MLGKPGIRYVQVIVEPRISWGRLVERLGTKMDLGKWKGSGNINVGDSESLGCFVAEHHSTIEDTLFR
jgi:hypothetical protein